jgi:hypothetical protein
LNPPNAARLLQLALDRFGRWLRWWSALRGLAQWVLAVFGMAAISFVVDYFLEPNRTYRIVALVVFAAALLWLLGRWVLSPLFVRWTPSALAAALERRVPAMNERLVTAVEVGEFPPAPALLERVHLEAAELAREVFPAAILSIRSTARLLATAMLIGIAALVLVMMNADLARTWWRRVVLLEPIRYPRETSLSIEGFRDGVRKVGRGRDVEIVVKASGQVPQRATLELVNARSSSQRRHVLPISGAGEFRHRFRTVVGPMEFMIQAGDERTDVLRLEPVDPPAVRAVASTIEAPSYTGLPTKTQVWTNGPVNAPAGSRIAVEFAFEKPIAEIAATLAGRPIEIDRRSTDVCVATWEVVDARRLTVRFANEDGVEGDEPFSLDVVAVVDRPPAFEKIEPSNVGPAVTRLAALPVALSLIDDYGVEQAAFVLDRKGSDKSVRIPLATIRTSSDPKPVVELGPLGFKEGDRFTLTVEASDLPPADPFLGEPWASRWSSRTVRSPSFAFEVVAPDELQARLAARELNHRLRFEQTLRELRDARRTLADAGSAKDAVATLQRLRVEEALQTIRKTANETRELSAAFYGLVEEFRNNRVGASGMLERLERSVADPLRRLAEESFVERVREMQALAGALGTTAFPRTTDQAIRGLDLLLKQGEAILAAMRKMENFNELVSALRGLRDEQNKLLQETKEERKRRILDLVK